MFPKQRERYTLYCCSEGHGPKKKTTVGHTGQTAPYVIWKRKKKIHARVMAQNSRASLDLKGTRQMGITPVLVKTSVGK